MIGKLGTAIFLGTVVGCSVSEPTQSGKLIINEIMVKNSSSSGVISPNGESEDFIELYNGSEDTVWLNHYFLSDNSEEPTKRNLPVRQLAPREFAVFYGGDSPEFPDLYLQFNFSSDSGSNEIALLVDQSITRVDSVRYFDNPSSLKKGKSFGRLGDGGSSWVVQKNPTPGRPNNE